LLIAARDFEEGRNFAMLGAPMIMKITTERLSLPFDHVAAHEFLTKNDPHLADVITRTGEVQFKLDECDSVYESLLEAIVYQSISGKAAAKIFSRIQALGANGVCPTPAEILKTRIPALRKAGLSKAKALAMKDLAHKTIDGVVPTLDAAQKMSDEELVERLISVRGIGAWTVEMFLIFRLGRPDVLPIHDLGVQKGWAITYRKRKMPKPKELLKFGERWRPWRTIASWYMWRAVHLAGKDARKIIKLGPKKKRPPIKKGART
jgi:DNA-3-methyladenine glycosylase II